MEILPLFTTLVQKLNYVPSDELIDFVHHYYSINKVKLKLRSSRNGWQSPPFKILPLAPVYKYIEENIYLNCDIRQTKAWINVNTPGAYNVTHTHPNSDYTFVYYLTDSDAPIVLDCPDTFARYNHIVSVKKEYATQYGIQTGYRIQPKKGDILIFPSYIPHSVETNLSDTDRISISWGACCLNCGKIPRW